MTEQEYRELPNEEYYSYSLLSSVDKNGPSVLLNKKNLNSTGVRWGSLADTMMLAEEHFEEKYKVLEHADSVSETYQKLHEQLKKSVLEDNISIEDIREQNDKYLDICFDITKQQSLWNNIKKNEIFVRNFTDPDFLNFCIEDLENINDGRIFIKAKDYLDVKLMCQVLRTNPLTKDYFTNDSSKKKQVLYQIAILFTINGRKFKSLLDCICIDHHKKTVRFIDQKTGSKPYKNFISDFFKFRYDLQSAIYTLALESFILEQGLNDYTILNPIYVYIYNKDVELPVPFQIEKETINHAIKGYIDIFGKTHKGVINLIEDIEYYRDKKEFKYERDLLEKRSYIINNRKIVYDIISEFNIPYRNYKGKFDVPDPTTVNTIDENLGIIGNVYTRRDRSRDRQSIPPNPNPYSEPILHSRLDNIGLRTPEMEAYLNHHAQMQRMEIQRQQDTDHLRIYLGTDGIRSSSMGQLRNDPLTDSDESNEETGSVF
jgi:hypothetical protein